MGGHAGKSLATFLPTPIQQNVLYPQRLNTTYLWAVQSTKVQSIQTHDHRERLCKKTLAPDGSFYLKILLEFSKVNWSRWECNQESDSLALLNRSPSSNWYVIEWGQEQWTIETVDRWILTCCISIRKVYWGSKQLSSQLSFIFDE